MRKTALLISIMALMIGVGVAVIGQTISIVPLTVSVTSDATATFDVRIGGLGNGLKRVNVDIQLPSDCAADLIAIESGNLPSFSYLTTTSDIAPNGKSVRLVAFTMGSYSGSGGTVYRLTVRGKSSGSRSCSITIVKNGIVDKDDRDITANTTVQNGRLSVGGGTCTYSISPSSRDFTEDGGTGTVSVTASPSTCTWTAQTDAAWITIISGSSGTGNGTVRYRVDPNSGAQRTGHITVEGRMHTVTQDVIPTVTADFSWEPSNPTINEKVHFHDQSQAPTGMVLGLR